MKTLKIILLFAFTFVILPNLYSQNINWESLQKSQKHIAHFNGHWDYALGFGAAYGYQLNSKIPVVLNASFSKPAGEKVLDDFKTRIGAQFRIVKINNFQVTASVQAIYRRYQNPLVRIQNFGSELGLNVGYFRSRFFIAGEFGFDKAILTNFKHAESFKINFDPDVRDGWYQPSTGGNFNYGIVSGYSFGQSDITFKIGMVLSQDLKTTPFVPFYAQLGYNFRFGGK